MSGGVSEVVSEGENEGCRVASASECERVAEQSCFRGVACPSSTTCTGTVSAPPARHTFAFYKIYKAINGSRARNEQNLKTAHLPELAFRRLERGNISVNL